MPAAVSQPQHSAAASALSFKDDTMTEHRPLMNTEVRAVDALTEAGVPSKIIAPVIGRSFHSANYIKRRYNLRPPRMTHMVGFFHVSEHCWAAMREGARRYSVPVTTIARSILELTVRQHSDVAARIVLPPAAVIPAPIQSLVHVDARCRRRSISLSSAVSRFFTCSFSSAMWNTSF